MQITINLPINLQDNEKAMVLRHAIQQVVDELGKATQKHPFWPGDVIHQSAIVAEEAGEAVRAALQSVYENAPSAYIQTEFKQTAAMGIRAMYQHELKNLGL
jgi:hypothetical protein